MIFDIKGSYHHRKEYFAEQWWLNATSFEGHKKVLKCRNFVQINEDYNQTLVNIPSEKTTALQEIIKKDSAFLLKFNLMDYSLLFAIEKLGPDSATSSCSNRNSFYSGLEHKMYLQNSKSPFSEHLRYHFAIIDYLQEFNYEKKFEYVMKSVICKYNNISSINPERY